MTLNTDVYILDECDPIEVFRYCQGLLAHFDDRRRPAEDQKFEHSQSTTWRDGEHVVEPDNHWRIDNEPLQGLPAWLMLRYRPGSPLRTEEDVAAHDDWCNGPWSKFFTEDEAVCDRSGHDVPCWIELDFDTAYGYKSGGMGCGDLHAVLVARLGEWLTAKGLRWKWRNEFTGEVHEGPDHLVELCSGGRDANSWFLNTVLPAIAADAARSGGTITSGTGS